MKLKVKTTYTVTTDDLEIFCDPPLTFEAVGRINDKTHTDLLTWSKDDYSPDRAISFIPSLFLSVAQNGTAYPLTTKAEAIALREATGDKFICDLVESFWNYDYTYFKKKRLGSANSLPASDDGSSPEPTP
jgi:hypothetical protein